MTQTDSCVETCAPPTYNADDYTC